VLRFTILILLNENARYRAPASRRPAVAIPVAAATLAPAAARAAVAVVPELAGAAVVVAVGRAAVAGTARTAGLVELDAPAVAAAFVAGIAEHVAVDRPCGARCCCGALLSCLSCGLSGLPCCFSP
jgi:hypothetical protein